MELNSLVKNNKNLRGTCLEDSLKSIFPSFEGKNIIFNLLKVGTQSIFILPPYSSPSICVPPPRNHPTRPIVQP